MPLLAILLPVILMMVAFLLNLSYIELAQTELQIAADAASRAGGRTLANTGDMSLATAKAKELAELNTVAGEPLTLSNSNIEFGQATRADDSSRFEFTPASSRINSMRVNASRDTFSPDGPIRMLLPGILSTESVSTGAVSISTQVDLDISIVIDRSGSMAYADNEDSLTFDNPAAAPDGWQFGDQVPVPSRWQDAENALDSFLRILDSSPQREIVSLVTYGDEATLDVPLTDRYSSITDGMRALGDSFQEASTNIGGGIAKGITSLRTDSNRREFATKVILVLTDGIHNLGTSPELAARRAQRNDTLVFTITFSREADEARMKRVAEIANGKHFHADSAAELVNAFEEIGKSLPTLIVQ